MTAPLPDQPRRALFAAVSRLLRYPDDDLIADLDTIDRTAAALPKQPAAHLRALSEHLRATPLLDAQSDYVATFDLRRRNCLFLTYRQAGDTRRRGMALWRFQVLFLNRGYTLADGELPDFLPAVLELAAEAPEGDAEPVDLLVAHQAAIVALRQSLEADSSPYTHAILALEAALPRASRAVLDAARRIAEEGPPAEQVGIGYPIEAPDDSGSVEPAEIYLSRTPR